MTDPATLSLANLDLSVREIKIPDLLGKPFVLREPTEGAKHVWNTKQLKDASLDAEGNIRRDSLKLEAIGESNIELTGSCLFTEAEAAKAHGQPVGAAWVKLNLPTRVCKALLAKVLEMGELAADKKGEDEPKN